MTVLKVRGLGKRFGGLPAVDGVDLTVPTGSVYGVLGPNGAGKTTVIRMLSTLLEPDAGSARVLGHDVVAEADTVRGLVGLTGQFTSIDADLTGLESLMLVARLLGYTRAGGQTTRARAVGGVRAERRRRGLADVRCRHERGHRARHRPRQPRWPRRWRTWAIDRAAQPQESRSCPRCRWPSRR